MQAEALIPISIWVAVVLMTWVFIHYGHRKSVLAHKTLRLAIENGLELTPEMLDRFSMLKDPVRQDLRRGVLFLCFAAGLVLFGFIVGRDQAALVRILMGLSACPFLLGIAYLGFWKFGRSQPGR